MLILTLTLCHHSVAKEGKKIWLKSGDAKGLIDAIDELNKTNADSLSERSYILSAKVLSTLTLLVIRGAVRSHPGKRYSLNV